MTSPTPPQPGGPQTASAPAEAVVGVPGRPDRHGARTGGIRHSAVLARAQEADARSRVQKAAEARSAGGDGAESHGARRGPGRNLPAAIGVGLGLGAVVLGTLFLLPAALPAVVAVGIVLGVLELTRALGQGGLQVPAMPVLVGGIGMVVSTVVFGVDGLIVATAVAICVLIVWRVSESLGLPALRDVCAGVLTIAWIPFLGCFLLLLHDRPAGAFAVLLAIVVPVANDVGGYVAGVLFGAHPMAPGISPKKSWEGFAGSLVIGVASAVGVMVLGLGAPWWAGLILGAVIVVVSTCGDLAESLIKRDLGLKDMGHLLPGHGGVLDRVDSILLAAPCTYILLEILLP
ncbi:CDP-diglyceride synthetase [Brachybacterium phenoliresistens]|uniref:Phosphatidate cytidylyltransferase n=1 Tax=Brachybacterium phenoliresistens TaxID=396014 RepID=Z9JT38_9MICO|nr:phosphatidate cytidylyltransferase [Brachybacterium phenoliresistens]EWS81193.1 CDP-diglyceride synthetase [Brachybacterium phenoliresistens]